MSLIKKETFVCLDCETTGLDPKQDRVIEIAVCRFDCDAILESYETLVNPGVPIPESSSEIHHISDAMVASAPEAVKILPKVLQILGDHIIVGHGIQLDMEFVAEECKRASIPCKILNNAYFDTLRMARLYGQSPVNSLERLRQHFNIAEEGAHRAMSDVLVNIEVFKYLAEGFKTVNELRKKLEKPILLKVMPLGKHKGRPFSDIPVEYLQWAANKDFDQDLLFSIRSELKVRKKGQRFHQASNPFSEL